MKLLVFGATGKTGRHTVEQALAQGHEVTAFVRDPAKLGIEHERLHLAVGNINDRPSIDAAMPGQDVVISALGIQNRKHSTELSDGTRTILESMRAHGVPRIIVVTSLACGESKKQLKLWFMKLLIATVGKQIWADKDRQEQAVMQSGLDWIILRPGGLTDKPASGQDRLIKVDQDADFPKKAMISRADVAGFILNNLESRDWIGKPVSMCEIPD